MGKHREESEYALGANVTKLASAPEKKDTGVLSVRLPVEDIAAVESVADRTGRTLSQVVRDAVVWYVHSGVWGSPTTISISSPGGTFTTGSPGQYSKASLRISSPNLPLHKAR